MSFHIHVTYCGTSVRSVVEKTKSSKKERRLKVWTHAKLLQRNWNANCNTSDQGVISHSRAIKKQTSVYLWSLKQPSALLFELLEKIMFILNSTDNFFLAATLCSLFGSFVCFWNYRQISLTPGEDKFIISKNFHPFILPWQRYFIEEGNFQNTKHFWIFLKQLASLVVISYPKDQNDKWTRLTGP